MIYRVKPGVLLGRSYKPGKNWPNNPSRSASISSNAKKSYIFYSNGQSTFNTKTERFLSNAAGYFESSDSDEHLG